jgi:exosortase/archaeosortase
MHHRQPGTLSIPPNADVTQYWAQSTDTVPSGSTTAAPSSNSSSSATAGGVIAGLLSVVILIFATMFVLVSIVPPTRHIIHAVAYKVAHCDIIAPA